MEELVQPAILLVGFLWFVSYNKLFDFPIYFVVSGAVILFSNQLYIILRKSTLVNWLQGIIVY